MRILLILLFLFSIVHPIYAAQITQPPFPVTKQQQLQKKLATFTDKVKAERVLRINTLLSQINQTQTSYFLEDVTKLSSVIDQLQTLVTSKKTEKDTTNLTTDLKTANDTIENAKRAVLTQQKKDYTLTITSQKSAKADIQKTTDLLYNDLHSLQKEVTNAKFTVTQALDSTKLVLDETND